MKKAVIILLVILLVYPTLVKSQDITSGLYTGSEGPWGPFGLYKLNKDSTFLFFGNKSTSEYTTYDGKWQVRNGELKIFPVLPTRPLAFINSPVEYFASSKPSYDSVYFDLEATDISGNPISTYIDLSDSVSVFLKDGKYKGAIAIKDGTVVTQLKVNGRNIRGSFYSVKIPLMNDRNYHKIKIKVERVPEEYAFIPLTYADGPRRFELTQIDDGLFKAGRAQFRRVIDVSEIHQSFIKPRLKNPFFVPYFDLLENEFIEYFQSL